jgi:hypothetical protein
MLVAPPSFRRAAFRGGHTIPRSILVPRLFVIVNLCLPLAFLGDARGDGMGPAWIPGYRRDEVPERFPNRGVVPARCLSRRG